VHAIKISQAGELRSVNRVVKREVLHVIFTLQQTCVNAFELPLS